MLPLCLLATLALGQNPAPATPAADTGGGPTIIAVELGKADPEPGLLQHALDGAGLDVGRLAVSGWTDQSFTPSTARRDQLPMGFNYLANQYLLQQHWLRVEWGVDKDADGPTFGFLSDTILPGSDYRFTVARGLWDGQLVQNDGGPNTYGIDPIQFYAQARLPGVGQGLDVKLGRFFAPFGVESNAATLTPLASRSYTFIYNPFTQTGLLTTLQLGGGWSIKNGIVLGNDVFVDPAASPYYVGGLRWASDDDDASVDFTAILGSGRYNQGEAFHNPQVFDLVLSLKLAEKLTWKFEGLYGFTNNVPAVGFSNWYGLVSYATLDLTDAVAWTTRLEAFDDCQGQRTGTPGVYYAGTTGVTWKATPCLWLRPEVRLDHNDNRPFEGKPTLITACVDVLLTW